MKRKPDPVKRPLRIETRHVDPMTGLGKWSWRSSARRTPEEARAFAAGLAAGEKVRVVDLASHEVIAFFRPGDTAPYPGPACRACGCTDDDCRECIERTGEPCHWVEDDLCSACASASGAGQ